jgi:hypothetical protein
MRPDARSRPVSTGHNTADLVNTRRVVVRTLGSEKRLASARMPCLSSVIRTAMALATPRLRTVARWPAHHDL